MKMFKTISVFVLLFTGNPLPVQKDTCANIKGYLCNAKAEQTTPASHTDSTETPSGLSPPKGGGTHTQNSSRSSASETQGSGHVPGRSLPTLVVAGVSIALVLLLVLIVAGFWYAWKKSQEGSIEINPIPYGEAGVSLRTLSVPEN